MPHTTRLVTAEELEKFPDGRYELDEGRLVPVTPVGYRHGRVVVEFASLLNRHVRAQKLGVVLAEVGFKLRSDPDTVRGPDIAFIRQERIPSPEPNGFWDGPPDLAAEVVSPRNTASEVRRKTQEYLRSGVRAVVVIAARAKTVTVYRQSLPPSTFREGRDRLDLDDVVPGFGCRLQDIFE